MFVQPKHHLFDQLVFNNRTHVTHVPGPTPITTAHAFCEAIVLYFSLSSSLASLTLAVKGSEDIHDDRRSHRQPLLIYHAVLVSDGVMVVAYISHVQ